VTPLPGQPGQVNGQPRSIDNTPQTRPQDKTQQNRDQNQQGQRDQNQQGQRDQSADAHFITKAGEIDLAEINVGRLAAQRASRQEVRQFANQLVQDHSAHLTQLNQLANRNNWRAAERMDQEHQQLFQKLAGLQGQDFDREFVHKMVEGHKKAIELYQHAAKNCQNADLKNLANQTLAALQQHEKTAQQLSGQNPAPQGQTQQPTSAEQNDANRNQQNRTTDQNRNDQNRTTPSGTTDRQDPAPSTPNRGNQNRQDNNQKSSPDR